MPSKAETIGQALNGILSIEKFAAKVVPYLFSFQCVPSNAIPAQKWDFAKTFFPENTATSEPQRQSEFFTYHYTTNFNNIISKTAFGNRNL